MPGKHGLNICFKERYEQQALYVPPVIENISCNAGRRVLFKYYPYIKKGYSSLKIRRKTIPVSSTFASRG